MASPPTKLARYGIMRSHQKAAWRSKRTIIVRSASPWSEGIRHSSGAPLGSGRRAIARQRTRNFMGGRKFVQGNSFMRSTFRPSISRTHLNLRRAGIGIAAVGVGYLAFKGAKRLKARHNRTRIARNRSAAAATRRKSRPPSRKRGKGGGRKPPQLSKGQRQAIARRRHRGAKGRFA